MAATIITNEVKLKITW